MPLPPRSARPRLEVWQLIGLAQEEAPGKYPELLLVFTEFTIQASALVRAFSGPGIG